MSADYDGIQACIETAFIENWKEHVEIDSEPNTVPDTAIQEYIRLAFRDIESARTEYGPITQVSGNIVVRVFGPENEGAKPVRSRMGVLDTFLETENADLALGVELGASTIVNVVTDPQRSLLVGVYVIPFRSV